MVTAFFDRRKWFDDTAKHNRSLLKTLTRFSSALRGLPPHRRRLSLLPMLAAYSRPLEPRPADGVPAARFTATLDGPVPSLTPEYIGKYVSDLQHLDLI
jgi:fatty acid CoA ligase FadD9